MMPVLLLWQGSQVVTQPQTRPGDVGGGRIPKLQTRRRVVRIIGRPAYVPERPRELEPIVARVTVREDPDQVHATAELLPGFQQLQRRRTLRMLAIH